MNAFRAVNRAVVPEIDSQVVIYEHLTTGATVVSIENDDENKAFCIGFRTVPTDSTGVAHILEHSVLNGSERYPVKEPFADLLKGSLNTFLNAFTYPDRTLYPVASTNEVDFYNLVNVYLDAVFKPLLTRETFMQEGWHFEATDPEKPLTIKGVVYNEMKGSYSSPDRILYEQIQRSLFPDTTYSYDSGGDPAVIPDLTYEDFLKFHRRHYHPSNACAVFSGNDDPEKRLELLDQYFAEYNQATPAEIDSQPAKTLLTTINQPYAVSETKQATYYLTVNWLLPSELSNKEKLKLTLLNYLLVDTPASVLRKRLLDSGFGSDLAGMGMELELRQAMFSLGLKGIKKPNLDKVEPLILDTLKELSETSFSDSLLKAAFNTIEFKLRERNTGSFPRGLAYGLSVINAWMYGQDILDSLRFETDWEELKAESQKPDFFKQTLKTLFLKNQHRTTVILEPQPQYAKFLSDQEQARIASLEQTLTESELTQIITETKQLRELQALQLSETDQEVLPHLEISDLEKTNVLIPTQKVQIGEQTVLLHDLFTSGVTYLDLAFNFTKRTEDEIKLLPIFAKALTRLGTTQHNSDELTSLIGQKTGGISVMTHVSGCFNDPQGHTVQVILSGKALSNQVNDLFQLIEEIVTDFQPDNKTRFLQLVKEAKSDLERQVHDSGHMVVAKRLAAHISKAGLISELIGGIEQLQYLENIEEQVISNWPAVLTKLKTLQLRLVSAPIVVNLTADQADHKQLTLQAQQFLKDLQSTSNPPYESTEKLVLLGYDEQLLAPLEVNYVGQAWSLKKLPIPLGSLLVINHYLRSSWLWDEVRVKGGAYGAFSVFDVLTKSLSFLTYRDPHVESTLKIFEQTAEHLQSVTLSKTDIAKLIIGTISQFDPYLLPDAKGMVALTRYLANVTETQRQEWREEILKTSLADFQRFGEYLGDILKSRKTVVLSSPHAQKLSTLGFKSVKETEVI